MISAVRYNSSTTWPGFVCDAIYIAGNPFMIIPPAATGVSTLYEHSNYACPYDITMSRADHFRVITGGEPFCHYVEWLVERIYKRIECPIRIDTDGAYPFRLEQLLMTDMISHVCVKLWYPPERYKVQSAFPPEAILRSIKVATSFPSHEVQVQYDHNVTDIDTIVSALQLSDTVTIKPCNDTIMTEHIDYIRSHVSSYIIQSKSLEFI